MFLFDMGLPMIFPSLFLSAVALVPVILIEAYIIGTAIPVGIKKALPPVAIANLVSTFVGIPVTWVVLTLIEFLSVNILGFVTDGNIWTRFFSVTLGAPWVAPGHKDEQWIILGAMLFLLIPYGLASWWIELKVIQKSAFEKMLSADEGKPIESLKLLQWGVAKANVVSYAFLAILVIAIFAASSRF